MLGKEEKRKLRLTFDGYNLYPLFEKIRKSGELKKLINLYGEAVYQYYKSIDVNGSSLPSKPFIVYGSRESLDKFLTYFLLKNDNLQGKKYSIEDLMMIKDYDEEDIDQTFLHYPEMAIADIHKHAIDYGNMEEWRNSNIMQAITTRQRNRLPVIVLSEKVLPTNFKDISSFTYIDLFNYSEIKESEEINNVLGQQNKPQGTNYNSLSL